MSYSPRSVDYEAENRLLVRAATIPGNPIAHSIQTAFADTAGLAILRNSEARALNRGGGILLPRYLRAKLTTIPASATAAHWALSLDDIDRYTSGGSQLGVAANTTAGWTRSDYMAQAISGRLDFGAIVCPAAGTNRKIIGQGVIRSVVPVVNDVFIWVFGDPNDAALSQDTSGAGAKIITINVDEVALFPNGEAGVPSSLILHVWYPANAATPASYEVDAGWLVRK